MNIPAKIVNGKKQCRLCLEWKDTLLFGTFLNKKKTKTKGIWIPKNRYINSRCKSCASQVTSEWGKKNRERLSLKWKKEKEEMLLQIRNAYGNKCSCCGESNPIFLTIDHVNNDGYKIRPRNLKGYSQSAFSGHYYKQIIKANFPDTLQLLCWNCNCGKNRNGGICPHKKND